ncbi:hypothetical protein CYMTET_6699 [Cymbomonas tetramitiformis]|uniref:Right handed beta helix domain-containing protein n=1 Tax=Cymbomonas tetramitiformis TaxID=36881 RepID=A0AAE0LI72_9CHLO|nr:hypothetical protein CYMTET_6699 [Cymbomonas tetramitiformis]
MIQLCTTLMFASLATLAKACLEGPPVQDGNLVWTEFGVAQIAGLTTLFGEPSVGAAFDARTLVASGVLKYKPSESEAESAEDGTPLKAAGDVIKRGNPRQLFSNFLAYSSGDSSGPLSSPARAEYLQEDAQCTPVNITFHAVLNASEVSWYIDDMCNDGTIYNNTFSEDGRTFNKQCCLTLGNISVTCWDSYGDGWHGGYLSSSSIDGSICQDFTSGSSKVETYALTLSAPSPPAPPVEIVGSVAVIADSVWAEAHLREAIENSSIAIIQLHTDVILSQSLPDIYRKLAIVGSCPSSSSGEGNDGKCAIDGQQHVRILTVSGTSGELHIDGLVLQNGYASTGGGIYGSSGASVTVTNSTIRACAASGYGGGIYGGDGASVAVTNSTISNCAASDGSGGGIHGNAEASVTVTNSIITNCAASSDGGGIYGFSGASVTVTNSTIRTCAASGYGGGMYGVMAQCGCDKQHDQ